MTSPVAWIDLALIANEPELASAVGSLTVAQRSELMTNVVTFLDLDKDELQLGLLRVLLERVRPYALSRATWARPITSSTDLAAEIQTHFERLDIAPLPERIARARALYVQFVDERKRVSVSTTALLAQNYRCGHCGLAFFNEELSELGLVSPFGTRGVAKADTLKMQWTDLAQRLPTVDHDWPVSLYGDNTARNLRVLCRACNQGKEDYMLPEQMKPVTGLPRRRSLTSTSGVLPADLFYAQIRRAPHCHQSGVTATTSELTVAFRDARMPAVLDNLLTVATPDI